MIIKVETNIWLELVDDHHATALFNLANVNRGNLLPWLPWLANMQSVEFIQKFIAASKERNNDKNEYAFVIMKDEEMIGRIGVYKIDLQNKIGEIGYWLGENIQGKGIVTKCCLELINFCFDELNLNRIEIKCGSENLKSKTIPQRLNFKKEGILRQAEYLHGKFIDLDLYAFIKEDRNRL